jgi:hypothetical protein
MFIMCGHNHAARLVVWDVVLVAFDHSFLPAQESRARSIVDELRTAA